MSTFTSICTSCKEEFTQVYKGTGGTWVCCPTCRADAPVVVAVEVATAPTVKESLARLPSGSFTKVAILSFWGDNGRLLWDVNIIGKDHDSSNYHEDIDEAAHLAVNSYLETYHAFA